MNADEGKGQMNTITFTPTEQLIFNIVDRLVGKRKGDQIIAVEAITACFVDPDDDTFRGRNKSMLANIRHLAIKSRLGGPYIFERHAPIKRGRPVTNGMGNKAEYIVRKRTHQ